MSLFIREHPWYVRNNNSLFDDSFFEDIENEFFNHPLISFSSLYPYYSTHPVQTLEKQVSKDLNDEVFQSTDFSPKINLSEDEKNYYIYADLPGMTKDQVKMELSDDRVLTISGERKTIIDDSKDNEDEKKGESTKASNVHVDGNENNENKETKESETKKTEQKETKPKENQKETTKKQNNKKYTRIECSYGKFSRSFSIPEDVDMNNIKAKMENGVLEVTLAKIEPPKQEHKHIIQIQ